MTKKLHIECSPSTGTIFAGHVLKNGTVWAKNKQDVTIEALVAAADHCTRHAEKTGRPVEITKDGFLEYRITVESFK